MSIILPMTKNLANIEKIQGKADDEQTDKSESYHNQWSHLAWRQLNRSGLVTFKEASVLKGRRICGMLEGVCYDRWQGEI